MNYVLTIFISLLLFSAHGEAYVRIGNGGGSVVCRNPQNGKITSAQMLDLYEAKELWKLQLASIENTDSNSSDSDLVVSYFERALSRFIVSTMNLKNSIDGLTKWRQISYQDFQNRLSFIPNHARLEPVADYNTIYMPKDPNCSYSQVAIYTNDDRILVDPEIWHAFDSINKAALMMHELYYRQYFEYVNFALMPTPNTTYVENLRSDRVRIIIGYLFSTESLQMPFSSLTEGHTKEYRCIARDPLYPDLRNPVHYLRILIYKNENLAKIQFAAFEKMLYPTDLSVTAGYQSSSRDIEIFSAGILSSAMPIQLEQFRTEVAITNQYLQKKVSGLYSFFELTVRKRSLQGRLLQTTQHNLNCWQ